MKKKYIAPLATIVEFDSEALMYDATSSYNTGDNWSQRRETDTHGWDSSNWNNYNDDEAEE